MREARHKGPHVVWFHWCVMSHIGKFLETASQLGLPGAGVVKRMELLLRARGFCWGHDDRIPRLTWQWLFNL